MASILQDLQKTIIAGIVLTIVFFVLVRLLTGAGFSLDHAWFAFLFRWLHVVSGVMWIGLLWYFNFVQIPNMPNIPDDQKPAIGKVIAPGRPVVVPLGRHGHHGHRHHPGRHERVPG